jgi:flagellar hook-basal body complex protein FliE
MSGVDAIAAVGLKALEPLASSAVSSTMAQATQATATPFASVLDQLSGLNRLMQTNDVGVQQVALGNLDNLHQVMMNLESARLQLDFMLQVRNKIMDGYQELMRMQV